MAGKLFASKRLRSSHNLTTSRNLQEMASSSTNGDVGKLIKMIKQHPILYDSANDQYKDHDAKNEIWCRIADDLGFESSESVKTKWRNLRDSYLKYLKYSKGKDATLRKYSRWPWASKMEFLKPYLPLKMPKVDRDSDERDDSAEIYVEQVDTQEIAEEDEEERKVFDVMPVKRAKMQSPDDVMARRVSNMEAIDHLFLSYAQTMKTFSLKRQVMIKSQLAAIMSQAELEEISEQEECHSSLYHHLNYEYHN